MASTDAVLVGAVLPRGIISCSATAGALTISILTPNGTDPSPTDPLFTSTWQDPSIFTNYGSVLSGRAVVAPLSLTISNGSTLGVAAVNKSFRLWVVLIDDSGTFRLGVVNCLASMGNILSLDILRLYNTTAEGGAGAADAAGVIYTNVAVTGKAIRVIGSLYFGSGLATLGTWIAPGVSTIYVPGMYLPGQEVKWRGLNSTSEVSIALAGLMPADNTKPQLGSETISLSQSLDVDNVSSCNVMEVEFVGNFTFSAVGLVAVLVYELTSASNDPLGMAWGYSSGASIPFQIALKLCHRSDQGQMQYRFYAGSAIVGTLKLNSSTLYGGALTSYARAAEKQA